ncbi:MAG TPA: GNAT family N-acetyltransferase [Mucilaginibacter sp.]|jgi:GNAT superfamily N-acetyltransferase
MEQVTVRTATLDDLETLLGFEQGIISAERPFDPTLKDEQISYYSTEQMITAPHIEVVVAEVGGELVGSGYARIEASKPYLKHQNHAFLGFMFVKPEYRGKGINQKIIEALKQWSLAQNITEMRLEVYDENLPAVRAYKKMGFSKHMVQMRLGIS